MTQRPTFVAIKFSDLAKGLKKLTVSEKPDPESYVVFSGAAGKANSMVGVMLEHGELFKQVGVFSSRKILPTIPGFNAPDEKSVAERDVSHEDIQTKYASADVVMVGTVNELAGKLIKVVQKRHSRPQEQAPEAIAAAEASPRIFVPLSRAVRSTTHYAAGSKGGPTLG